MLLEEKFLRIYVKVDKLRTYVVVISKEITFDPRSRSKTYFFTKIAIFIWTPIFPSKCTFCATTKINEPIILPFVNNLVIANNPTT